MSCNTTSFESSSGSTKFRTPSILPLKGPSLEDLKLVNILNSETCPPISFKNFTTFITEKEHTTENLLFVIWYKSYEVRWRALDQVARDKVPVPSTRLGDRYDPFRLMAPDHEVQEVGDQPMREEAVRAFATFLKQDGSRALGVSDELRRFARTSLTRSSAPECFLPLYEEVYHTIETQSLPHFLTHVSANVNRPKQLFWYYVGAFDFFLGAAIYLVLTLALSSRHFGLRATRLPSTIFAAFGSMQMYSAYRGFCSQVWNRKSRQLWPWELDEAGDEEVSIQSKHETEGSERAFAPSPSPAPPLDTRHSVSPHPSFFSENIFTPTSATREMTLSPEVYPLTDFNDPVTPSTAVEAEGDPEKVEELTELQRSQLAIRRSTIKVPDASLAFPISEDDHVGDLTTRKPSHRSSAFESLRPSVSSLASGSFRRPSPSLASPLETPNNRRSDISPFEEPPLSVLPKTEANVSTTSVPQAITPQVPGRPDLSALLDKFRFTGQKCSAEDDRPKMFGPESPVQDPRVTELFDSVVRDILAVGVISGLIWVALCLAVPCAGLV